MTNKERQRELDPMKVECNEVEGIKNPQETAVVSFAVFEASISTHRKLVCEAGCEAAITNVNREIKKAMEGSHAELPLPVLASAAIDKTVAGMVAARVVSVFETAGWRVSFHTGNGDNGGATFRDNGKPTMLYFELDAPLEK